MVGDPRCPTGQQPKASTRSRSTSASGPCPSPDCGG